MLGWLADWLIKNGFPWVDWYVSGCEWYYDSWVCPPCFCIPYSSAGSGFSPKWCSSHWRWSGRLDPLQERKEKRRKTGEEPSDSDSEDMEELLGRFSNVQQAHCRGRRWMFWLASTNALLRELIQGKSRLWTWEWDVSFAKKCIKWIHARLFVRWFFHSWSSVAIQSNMKQPCAVIKLSQ